MKGRIGWGVVAACAVLSSAILVVYSLVALEPSSRCEGHKQTLQAALVCEQRGCMWTLGDVVRVREALTYYDRNCRYE